MQLYIDREILAHALANIQGIIEKRSTHPLLSHVCIEAEEEMLRLTATDTEVTNVAKIKMISLSLFTFNPKDFAESSERERILILFA